MNRIIKKDMVQLAASPLPRQNKYVFRETIYIQYT